MRLMKTATFLNKNKVMLNWAITLCFLLIGVIEGHSQIVLDGDQCLTTSEYGTPDTIDGDDGYSAPSEILNFWGSYQVDNGTPYVYFAFDREASGAAGFAVYIDNTCLLYTSPSPRDA